VTDFHRTFTRLFSVTSAIHSHCTGRVRLGATAIILYIINYIKKKKKTISSHHTLVSDTPRVTRLSTPPQRSSIVVWSVRSIIITIIQFYRLLLYVYNPRALVSDLPNSNIVCRDMDEGTLHMARAMASMSIHEEELYSVGIKSDMTVVGKIKMQDKLQGFRYDTFCMITCIDMYAPIG
jgi:hypothetical protein